MNDKENAEEIYADIIHMPHHQSDKRKHMSMHDRAAQFAPFAALSGYDSMIREEGRLTLTQREISEYQSEILNRRLRIISDEANAGEAPEITLVYFRSDKRKSGGSYETITAKVKEVDTTAQKIILYGSDDIQDRRVPTIEIDFSALTDILTGENDDMND